MAALYETDIPADAEQRGPEYWLDGELVGRRNSGPHGAVEYEAALRAGRPHGRTYWFREGGMVCHCEPFEEGLPHGVASQFDQFGQLIGTYEMDHGTGWDLWYNECPQSGTIELAEARHYRNGERDGFEWWFRVFAPNSISEEAHYRQGRYHGIRRSWSNGRLDKRFPEFYVDGIRVSRHRYRQACRQDAHLPRWRAEDDRPARKFPPIVAAALVPRPWSPRE